MSSKLRFFPILITVLLLASCATPPPITEESTQWDSYQQQLAALERWSLRAQIAFISPEQRQKANLWWQQDQQQSHTRLTGPLGVEVFELRYQPGQVWLKDDKKNEYRGNDAQALLQRLTGWQLPVEQLPRILIGLPASDLYQLNDADRLAAQQIAQQWQIDYLNYANYSGRVLPRQMQLVRNEITIKINIVDWQIND
ncbi:lipoprotein insertase outer membrane protein LolB [Aliagarivorans marinus]|uniref:lipoprotein insertase outer membrane protein LolB n=1 Tax=Aliagarivorans marinus TaxID=561965 RepID=UPI00047C2771|nr:lipoprotein insertase outer membrane protein LolB [Aliagarivorans marinus]